MISEDSAQASVNGGAHSATTPSYLEFKAAVLELSHARTPAALLRYLNASRALDGLEPRPRQPVGLVNGHQPRQQLSEGRP
jgi:hypothetical protein